MATSDSSNAFDSGADGRGYTSAFERLQQLPAVFTGRDLTRHFAWRSDVASSYIAAWKRRGLVRSLGGRSDVHFNLIAAREPNVEAGLHKAYPRGVRVGLHPLTEGGWTTQIAQAIELAVPADSKMFSVEGVRFTLRSEAWFGATMAGIRERSAGALHHLRPAWALADMLQRAGDGRVRDAWLPDPEDIDWHRVAAGGKLLQRDWRRASDALGLRSVELAENCYLDAYDAWRATRDERELRLAAGRPRRPAGFAPSTRHGYRRR